MLEKAREKVPAAEFLERDMLDFKLNHRYKAAVNLYGSIGFAENLQRMENGIRCVWECLEEGGVLILTPWGTKETVAEEIEMCIRDSQYTQKRFAGRTVGSGRRGRLCLFLRF